MSIHDDDDDEVSGKSWVHAPAGAIVRRVFILPKTSKVFSSEMPFYSKFGSLMRHSATLFRQVVIIIYNHDSVLYVFSAV